MTTEEILAKNGWTVECQSPFEIRHEDGSFATGSAAHTVVSVLESDQLLSLNFEEIRVCIKALNSMQTSLTLQSCSRDFGSEEFFEKLLAKFYEAHNEALEEWKESHPSQSFPKDA